MRSWLMMTLAAVLTIPLAACNQTASGGTSVCAVWRPITWSQQDTPQTIGEAKANNARQRGWCA